MDTREEENTLKVRQTAGMVFQNPDNQIVGTLVDEEVGFGPENIGVPTEEIWERVEKSLKAVGMYAFRNQSPNKLSGGQKQRVAALRALLLHPQIVLADEPTGALDSRAAQMLLETFRKMNHDMHSTILMVTHDAFSASYCSRILFLKDGKIFHELVRGVEERREFLNKILDVLSLTGGELSDVR